MSVFYLKIGKMDFFQNFQKGQQFSMAMPNTNAKNFGTSSTNQMLTLCQNTIYCTDIRSYRIGRNFRNRFNRMCRQVVIIIMNTIRSRKKLFWIMRMPMAMAMTMCMGENFAAKRSKRENSSQKLGLPNFIDCIN